MATEPQSPPSETDRLTAALAKLEAEREQRVVAGKWSRGVRPRLMAIPQTGETLQTAQQRAVYQYLATNPDAPKAIAAYDWMTIEVVDPPPIIELPDMILDHDHGQARDVTSPPPFRPPMPPAPPPPEPWRGPSRMDRVIETHNAIKRRAKQFHDGDWKPHDGALRYPRGRNGW